MAAGSGVSDPAQKWSSILAANLGRSLVNNGVGGYTSTQTATLQTADQSLRDWIAIYDCGANGATVPQYSTDINAMIAHQTGNGRFLIILPCIPSTAQPNNPGQVDQRTWIKATYPNNYVDCPSVFSAHGDGSTQDNADIANGYTPTSLRAVGDSVHLNAAGQVLKEATIQAAIQSKGW